MDLASIGVSPLTLPGRSLGPPIPDGTQFSFGFSLDEGTCEGNINTNLQHSFRKPLDDLEDRAWDGLPGYIAHLQDLKHDRTR